MSNDWSSCHAYEIPSTSTVDNHCCHCNCHINSNTGFTQVSDKYLKCADSDFDYTYRDVVIYFTDMKPNNMNVNDYICDNCIYELLYDGTLQFDFKYPWYDYNNVPTKEQYLGSKLDLNKYKPVYNYKKRLYRNFTDYSDFNYPYIFSNNIEKIKMNPDLFGEFSRKIAKNL